MTGNQWENTKNAGVPKPGKAKARWIVNPREPICPQQVKSPRKPGVCMFPSRMLSVGSQQVRKWLNRGNDPNLVLSKRIELQVYKKPGGEKQKAVR